MKKLLLLAGLYAHAFISTSDQQSFPPVPPVQGEEMNRLLLAEFVKLNKTLEGANTIATQVRNNALEHQRVMRSLKVEELNHNPSFRVMKCLCCPIDYILSCCYC